MRLSNFDEMWHIFTTKQTDLKYMLGEAQKQAERWSEYGTCDFLYCGDACEDEHDVYYFELVDSGLWEVSEYDDTNFIRKLYITPITYDWLNKNLIFEREIVPPTYRLKIKYTNWKN